MVVNRKKYLSKVRFLSKSFWCVSFPCSENFWCGDCFNFNCKMFWCSYFFQECYHFFHLGLLTSQWKSRRDPKALPWRQANADKMPILQPHSLPPPLLWRVSLPPTPLNDRCSLGYRRRGNGQKLVQEISFSHVKALWDLTQCISILTSVMNSLFESYENFPGSVIRCSFLSMRECVSFMVCFYHLH